MRRVVRHKYGNIEVNPKEHGDEVEGTVDWRDLGRDQYHADRLRLLADYGRMDVSYFHVRDHKGRLLRVTNLPFLPGDLKTRAYRTQIIAAAKRDGIFVAGIIDAVSILY